MTYARSRRIVLAASTLSGGLLLAACGSAASSAVAPAASGAATTSAAASAAGSASSAGAAGGGYGYGYSAPSSSAATTTGKPVTATETDFHIALSSQSLTPGTYTFTVQNNGQTTHALTVVGPGVHAATSGAIAPGSTGTLTVTLTTGSYDVYCPVANHKMLGMDDHITVA